MTTNEKLVYDKVKLAGALIVQETQERVKAKNITPTSVEEGLGLVLDEIQNVIGNVVEEVSNRLQAALIGASKDGNTE